jgi:hypothetical protein
VRIAAISRPCPGESANGDGYLVAAGTGAALERLAVSSPAGAHRSAQSAVVDAKGRDQVLLALVDGVGHGPEAAAVAADVLRCIERNLDLELRSLAVECHRAVLYSRGAALGLLRIDRRQGEARYLGVGNVQAHVGIAAAGATAVTHPINNQGIVGYNLPSNLIPYTCAYRPDDTLIAVHSDGIDDRLDLREIDLTSGASAESIAKSAAERLSNPTDDATLIVVIG